jgi:hypothetical protein
MPAGYVLSRILLKFQADIDDIVEITNNLSAVAITPDRSIWLGSDELVTDHPCVDRLQPIGDGVYGKHQRFALTEFIDLVADDDEVDLEGMDYCDHYLWITGSHSTTRKKPKHEKHGSKKALARLAQIKDNHNRCIIARIPIVGGMPFKHCSHPDRADKTLTAACLQKSSRSNLLLDALKQDKHLAPYLNAIIPTDDASEKPHRTRLPSKENGLDIEGLAVFGDRLFLGLRGPVLRGEWAVILELELEETTPGILTLKAIGDNGRKYRKHFLALNGLGVRDICRDGDDLIVLAGPTMDIEGVMELFRLKNATKLDDDSVLTQVDDDLELLAYLPFTVGEDHAEGITKYPCFDRQDALLVVYDSPAQARQLAKHEVLADIISL